MLACGRVEREEVGGVREKGLTITRAAKAPEATASGMSMARLHARVAVSQSWLGMASRMA